MGISVRTVPRIQTRGRLGGADPARLYAAREPVYEALP